MDDDEMDGTTDADERRVLILNPTAGSADGGDRVRALAAEHDFEVRETEAAGDAIELARSAADDADLVAAAGGDGTVNEVVRGLLEAEALGAVRLGIVPLGTGNNFAGNVGVTDVETAFDVLESGEVRTVDLGIANGRPFLNSAIGGLTAEASAETTSDAKARLGVLAYVLATFRTMVDFEGLRLHIDASDALDGGWAGEAAFVLVGNGRRFPAEGRSQANMEDGRLDVTVVEDRPAMDLVGEAAVDRLLGGEASPITRFLSSGFTVSVRGESPATFSLDGEMLESDALEVGSRERAVRLHVGEAYEPSPGG